ncbi:hypothetical protein JW835_15725, partial [bacterium]|nr:hypothetical protein [bacterium]
EGDGTRLSSLGVHEHWNNAADKQYSRNLGTGEGIELIHSDPMQNVTVKIRVFLEGPFNTSKDTMITSLKTSGNLTLSSPFSEDTVTVDSIPGNITDWILVQLRTSPQGPEIASKSAFLRNDGWIISSNGVTPFLTLNVNDGEYYISIKHRNHLSVISKNPVPLE